VRAAIYEGLRNLILFPYVGRPQTFAGVRKLVTRKYAYLVYYTVAEATEEIVILSVKHPARERDFG
jgi:toxin ParE1/3/4